MRRGRRRRHRGQICALALGLLASAPSEKYSACGSQPISLPAECCWAYTEAVAMRALIQRVTRAEVRVAATIVGAIDRGLLVLLGVREGDTVRDVEYLASKVVTLRIFEDAQGKMNHDVQDMQGAVLVVSQFTLYADSRKGRRPSFTQAARPALAQQLYETFLAAVARYGVPVAHGAFGAHMAVSLVNDGPVTLWLESPPAAE